MVVIVIQGASVDDVFMTIQYYLFLVGDLLQQNQWPNPAVATKSCQGLRFFHFSRMVGGEFPLCLRMGATPLLEGLVPQTSPGEVGQKWKRWNFKFKKSWGFQVIPYLEHNFFNNFALPKLHPSDHVEVSSFSTRLRILVEDFVCILYVYLFYMIYICISCDVMASTNLQIVLAQQWTSVRVWTMAGHFLSGMQAWSLDGAASPVGNRACGWIHTHTYMYIHIHRQREMSFWPVMELQKQQYYPICKVYIARDRCMHMYLYILYLYQCQYLYSYQSISISISISIHLNE